MTKIISFCKALIVCSGIFGVMTTCSYAGSSEEELKHEISFLAKKLLDMSGQESVTVDQPAYMKPFIGICSDVIREGVKLTCITPGHGAAQAGLKTGDLVVVINGVDMTETDSQDNKKTFRKLIGDMKTGDILAIKLLRNGQQKSFEVNVGSIDQPAYTLTVKNK